mmetsp:Transcript_26163/g.57286  ORF Transcript_26163/g.57286 Transcript_26163/m.57286 type:complete len:359 (-) Transcript_26163:130-1206(-)
MHLQLLPIVVSYYLLVLPRSNEKGNTAEKNQNNGVTQFGDNEHAILRTSASSSTPLEKRRQFLKHSLLEVAMVGAAAQFSCLPCHGASSDTPSESFPKPFAPTSALLPAVRAKLWIEDAHNLSEKLASTTTTGNNNIREKTLEDLNTILSHRPTLFDRSKGEKPLSRVSSTSLAQFTAKNDKRINNNGNNKDDPFSSSRPGERFAKALNRADVDRQWGMLQSQESKKEQENEVRAAFNYYTQQLEFNSNSYGWTGSSEERKRRIRDDQIPTPASVIASDLDLRDLYRNQLLTALDDVVAEVNYQFRQQQQKDDDANGATVDLSDTVELMNQVYVACTNWFDMIDAGAIESALEILRNE